MDKNEEELIHTYHMGIEFLAKVSIHDKEWIEKLQAKLEKEAVRSLDADSLALRILSNACEPYLQD